MSADGHTDELRATARRLLGKRSSSHAIRDAMMSPAGSDDLLWSELVAQGWAGIAVPDDLGGVGLGWREAAILFEEAGRHLLCAPMLSTTLAVTALRVAGSTDQQRRWLPPIASGQSRATVALPHVLGAGPRVRLDGDVVSGAVALVLDGANAELLVLPAAGADGPCLVIVRAEHEGVAATPAETMDLTRPMADITLESVPVDDLLPLEQDAMTALVNHAVTLLANEQVGVAARAFDESHTHAQTRMQFGRPIGSFQAVKHRLADMLVRLEAAKSVAWHAADVLGRGDVDELAVAAPMAASLCAEVACQLTADNIQVHGGIGFTWEHDAHLAFKRAEANRHLFGSPEEFRRTLGDSLELQPATT